MKGCGGFTDPGGVICAFELVVAADAERLSSVGPPILSAVAASAPSPTTGTPISGNILSTMASKMNKIRCILQFLSPSPSTACASTSCCAFAVGPSRQRHSIAWGFREEFGVSSSWLLVANEDPDVMAPSLCRSIARISVCSAEVGMTGGGPRFPFGKSTAVERRTICSMRDGHSTYVYSTCGSRL